MYIEQEASNPPSATKTSLHPRNAHRARYDFKQLVACSPELGLYVTTNRYQDESIDFADPAAVMALNRALLKFFYGITTWEIPSNYLCPPIPSRADYLHTLADLLASCNNESIPRGPKVRVLDIGVGANCIYPIIGQAEYDWSFVGSDIDPLALASAQAIVQANANLQGKVELRQQASAQQIFAGILQSEEFFSLSMCNPPFHNSKEEANAASRRKWHNLEKNTKKRGAPNLNFGGREIELICDGGETAFVERMVNESSTLRERCFWFSSLISKSSSLEVVYDALEKAGVADVETIELRQGQKTSRIVAWTFLNDTEQENWRLRHWQ